MSEQFYLSVRNCLVWPVEKPFCDSPRKSPTFSYLGNEWYFKMEACTNYTNNKATYSFYVFPEDREKVLHRDGKLIVFIQSVRNQWVKNVGTVILTENSDLLQLVEFEIKNEDSWYGHWIVYCIFSDDLPSELHIKESEANHLTSDLTAQSNLPSSSSIIMKAKLAASAADDSPSDEEILSTDFGKLLEQQSSDVTLTCGDRTFSAHRLILSARSEVFAAMFQNKMMESETGSINIKDIDGEVFELLLKYVYTGKIADLTVDIASRLYIAADKYSIHSLKSKCSKWMLGNLTEKNCLDFLVILDTLNDQILKDRLINFVAAILHLLEGDEWQKFSDTHPKLALSVYQRRTFSKPV